MRLFPRVLGMVTGVAFLGCAPDDSIGPRVAPGLIVTEADAANNKAHDVRPEAKAKVYCRNGTSCYAAAFYFTDYPSHPRYGGPYTLFTAYFQNLQGTYPRGGPSTVLGLGLFHFRSVVGYAAPDDFVDFNFNRSSITAIGNVQQGIGGNAWEHTGPFDWYPYNWDQWWALWDSWIVGCTVYAVAPNYFGKRTCPSQGLDGWVKVDFELTRRTWLNAFIRPPVRFDDFLFTFGESPFGNLCTIGGGQPGTCTELSYKQAMRN